MHEIGIWFLVTVVCWCAIHRLRQIGRPGFKTWPLIGASWEVLVNYHRIYDFLLWNFQVKQTKTFSVPLPAQSYVFTVDPANVEYILKSNFPNFPKGEVFHERFEALLGNGIFNSDGEAWKIQRKTASFEFASKLLREMSSQVFKEHAVRLAEIIRNSTETPVQIQDLFMRMTLDTICQIGFGVRLGVLSPALPDNEFAAAFDKCNAVVSYRFVDPLWKLKRLLRLGDEGALISHFKTIDNFTYDIIRKRRIQLQSQDHDKQDLLSRFMMMDDMFPDAALRDVVLNFVIAGRDTTASTLTYFIYMLATHPECASKLHKELTQFERKQSSEHDDPLDEEGFGRSLSRFTKLLTYDSLPNLVYLHAAINETLRLYPAVPLNFKGIVRRDVLPDGTVLNPGDIVSYVPYCMGRTESLWGSDATEFRPERWYNSSTNTWNFNISPFKFTAFQAGPRICLGKDSAYLQMKITAAILCRFFEFELVPGQDLHYRVMATISLENGIRVMCKCNL